MSTNPDIILRFSDNDIAGIASIQDFYAATGLEDFISDECNEDNQNLGGTYFEPNRRI